VPADRREHDEALLAAFGLEEHVELVWRALLVAPDEDVHSLATKLELAETSVFDALDRLTASNLARQDQTPSGFAAYDPSLAVETLIARTERDVAEQRERLQAVRVKLPALADTYARARATRNTAADVDVVVALDEIRERIYLSGERTTRDHRHLMRGVTATTIRNAVEVDSESLARGVHQRSLVGSADLADPEVYTALGELHDLGEEVRSIAYAPTQMMIMDRSLVVLPRAPIDSSRGALFIREQTIIDVLIYMFDHLWSTAHPVFGDAEASGAPTGRTARVLELVAAGVKDEKIARNLDIGVRTVRREIAELREILAVTSRAEMVAAAVRHGWL
jgi:DNA-binding CsgD family transcriptional regulator/sugar-specific transcriptional regulator TrmB